MTVPPGSDYFELADYLGVLRRRWTIVVALTLIGLVLAGAYYYLAPRTYASTVLVQVNALPTDANALGGRTGGPVNMDNEGQIVESATVASIAKEKLGSPLSIADLVKKVDVTVPPNTTFLKITCDESTADLAKRCANAFGRAYLYNRRFSTLNLVTTGLKSLYAQEHTLETSIEALKVKVKSAPATGPRSKGVLQFQLKGKVTRLDALTSKINSVTPLQANLAVKSTLVGTIVTPAVKPTEPVSPTKKLTLPSGLAAGLVLGLVFAFLLDWRRPRIRTARDVERRVELPTVFSLAEAKSGAQTPFAPPRSKTGQAFTEVAQYVGTALGDGHHVLLVAGTSPATSGSAVAANLAGALARTRGETVLICADPQGMSIPRMLGASDGRGFAEVLAGTAAVGEVMRPTADLPLLRVITPGLDAAGAVYDMQHDKVQRLMRELRREVRYVIVDVPAPSADADTFSLAEFADAAIVVVQGGTARPAQVTDCVQRLERMRTVVLAAILLPSLKRSRRDRKASAASDTSGYAPAMRQLPPLAGLGQSGQPSSAAAAAQVTAPMPVQPAMPPGSGAILPGQSISQPRYSYNRPAGPGAREPGVREPAGREPAGREPLSGREHASREHSSRDHGGRDAGNRDAGGREPGRDEGSRSGPPLIRPVTGRSTSVSTPVSSRHAASGQDAKSASGSAEVPPAMKSGSADSGEAPGAGGFSSAWTPRSVSETWPLPMGAPTEEDEEAGVSDPLIGN